MLGGTGPTAVTETAPRWCPHGFHSPVGQTDSSPGSASLEGWDWGSVGRRVRAGLEKFRDCWNPKGGILDQPRSQEVLPGGGGTGDDRNEPDEEKRKVWWAGAAAVRVCGGKSVVSVQGTESY